jgi:hypothetical protein
MTERTYKTKRPAEVRLFFRDEKSPDAKPSISSADVRRFVTAIESGEWREGVAEEAGCTYEGCGISTGRFKGLVLASLGVNVSCSYSCEWFYSKGGGWEHVCYANCQGQGVRLEAVIY